MPAFAYLRLTDKLACQGSVTTFGVLHAEDLTSASDILAVEDQESMQFRFSRLNAMGDVRAFATGLRAGRIVAVVWSDNSFDEWRVGVVTDGRGTGGVIDVQCVPVWRDLVERCANATGQGWVSQVVGGERIFDYEISQRTPSDILTNFVIANAPSYVTLGTVDPTVVLTSVSVKHMTPWAVALAVRDTLRAIDVSCELRLRRNGTTDYKLDLVTEIGSGAAVPVFHPSNALLTLTRKSDPTLQATRVLVSGGTAPDTLPGILGRARWQGGTPSGLTIVLSDPNGGAGPIGFDNQWVGAYLLRVKTGRTVTITASNAAAQTVTLADVSDIVGGEDFEFRLTEPQTNTRRRGMDFVPTNIAHANLFEITNVNGGTKKLTLTDNVNNTGIDPVVSTGQHTDWQLQRYTLVLDTTVPLQNGGSGGPLNNTLLVGATTGVQVGDIVILTTNAAAPYTWAGLLLYTIVGGAGYTSGAGILTVTTVNAGVSVVVTARDTTPISTSGVFSALGSSPFGLTANAARCRFYRPVATMHLITASDATANTVTVTAVGTAANTDVVEIVQVLGAGERPAYVDHPTYAQADPTGYGVKVMELQRAGQLGIQQLVPNSWQRTWSNHAAEPDGWSDNFTFTSLSRDTVAARFAGNSVAFTSLAGGAKTIYSPIVWYAWDPDHTNIAARGWVYYALIPTTNTTLGALKVYPMKADGTVGSALANATVCFAAGGATGYPQVAAGGWLEFRIEGLSLRSDQCDYGVVVGYSPASADTASGFVDTLEAYPFATCPTASYEFGDAVGLLQAGNAKLYDVASPPLFYTFTVFDLERAFPADYARLALTLGGSVRAADVDYGIDTTVRLLKIERDLLANTNTVLTLANRPTLLTSVINTNVLQQVQPAASLVTNAGSALVVTPPAAPPILANPSGTPAQSQTTATDVMLQPGDQNTLVPAQPTPPAGNPTLQQIVNSQPIGGQPPIPRMPDNYYTVG